MRLCWPEASTIVAVLVNRIRRCFYDFLSAMPRRRSKRQKERQRRSISCSLFLSFGLLKGGLILPPSTGPSNDQPTDKEKQSFSICLQSWILYERPCSWWVWSGGLKADHKANAYRKARHELENLFTNEKFCAQKFIMWGVETFKRLFHNNNKEWKGSLS